MLMLPLSEKLPVFTDSGRIVEHLMVDDRFVIRYRRVTTINEAALREGVAKLMVELMRDLDAVMERNQKMLPYRMEAHRRTWEIDIGVSRYIGAGDG